MALAGQGCANTQSQRLISSAPDTITPGCARRGAATKPSLWGLVLPSGLAVRGGVAASGSITSSVQAGAFKKADEAIHDALRHQVWLVG